MAKRKYKVVIAPDISDDERTYRFIPKWAYMIIYRVEELLKRVRVVGIFSTDQDPENVDEIKGR